MSWRLAFRLSIFVSAQAGPFEVDDSVLLQGAAHHVKNKSHSLAGFTNSSKTGAGKAVLALQTHINMTQAPKKNLTKTPHESAGETSVIDEVFSTVFEADISQEAEKGQKKGSDEDEAEHEEEKVPASKVLQAFLRFLLLMAVATALGCACIPCLVFESENRLPSEEQTLLRKMSTRAMALMGRFLI